MICTRNEADRYLLDCMKWNGEKLDDVFVYDDQSTDDTAQIARDCGAVVEVRRDEVIPFAVNEGAFRLAAWRAMEREMSPAIGDWIICLDADEFLIGDPPDFFVGRHEQALRVRVHECFGEDDAGYPKIRTDGFWGDIWGARFGRYLTGCAHTPEPLGGGSLPKELDDVAVTTEGISILHYGYYEASDRDRKYHEYSANIGRHSRSHVDSIMRTGRYERWTGKHPEFPF